MVATRVVLSAASKERIKAALTGNDLVALKELNLVFELVEKLVEIEELMTVGWWEILLELKLVVSKVET